MRTARQGMLFKRIQVDDAMRKDQVQDRWVEPNNYESASKSMTFQKNTS